jgi:single-stranded DNA-binding protein
MAGGALICRFPVAISDGNEKPTWQVCLAFADRARALEGRLVRGSVVSVVGYAHDRQVTRRNGTARVVTEIHVTAITFA